jgi:uncharacterized membrane protein YeaQ/YmgE (transglycosylase-associated protein family)
MSEVLVTARDGSDHRAPFMPCVHRWRNDVECRHASSSPLAGARYAYKCLKHARPGNGHPTLPGRKAQLMIGFLLYMLVIGIVAGFLARLLVPGRDPMGFWATVLLGVVGSFVGGFLGYLLFGKDLDEGALQASGVIGSIVGAVIVLLIYRAVSGSNRNRVR